MSLEGRRIAFVGCGALGGDAAARMARAGAEVFGLRRDAARVPAGVTGIAADVRAAAPLPLPFAGGGLDAVVIALTPGGGRAPEDYRATYVRGVEKTLEAARAAGASPLVAFVSSTGVYGQSRGEAVTEATPAEPTRDTAREIRAAERALEDAPLPSLLLRLGGIYGPGRGRLVESVRDGRATIPRGVVEWTNRIHQTDAARAIEFAVARALGGHGAERDVLDVVDRESAPRADVLRHIAERLGVRPPEVVDPPPGEPAGEPAETGKRVLGAKLRGAGFEHEFPTFREGYADPRSLLVDGGRG